MIQMVYVLPEDRLLRFEIPGDGFSTLIRSMEPDQVKQHLCAVARNRVSQFGKTLQPPEIFLVALCDTELGDFMLMIETDPDRLSEYLFVIIPDDYAILYHHQVSQKVYRTFGFSEQAMLLRSILPDDRSTFTVVQYEELHSDFTAYAFERAAILEKRPSRSA